MLKPAFTINLNEKLLPGLVSVGKFDGLNPCIVAATSSDKVLLHNPLRRAQSSDTRGLPSAAGTDVTYLNINQTIRSLTVGQLKKDSNNDILVLGTPTSIQVYDVINNVDLFYRDIPDGANAVIVGTIGSIEEPIAIAGGNCAIQGFDETGNERYWTITGDNIVSLALADLDSDDTNELIVGSEDYDIRVFKEDTILMEINETDSVKCVCPIRDECFGYALSNGTVGVYFKKERLWRIKSKNQAICIAPFHLNGDGIPKLVTGWSNGKIDVRDVETGEIVFKDSLNHSVAGIMSSDYNMDGIVELIVCSVSGEVRGYVPACAVAGVPPSHVQSQPSAGLDLALEQEMIRDLMKRKQNLLLELRNYETSAMLAQNSEFPIHSKASTEDDQYGAIPADTQLKSSLILNTEDSKPHIQLSLQTTNETIIRFVVIFAEGIFEGESYVVHPAENEISGSLIVPLRPDKDAPVDLHVKSMVGYRGSYHYHVFELSRHLPRFSMYSLVLNPSESGKPKSFVRFTLTEKINKIVMWINRNFLLVSELDAQNELNLTFISLRDGKQLVLEMADKSNELTIKTENIELAGSIIQSLAADFCGITNLRSMSDFPKEIEQLKKMIQKVEELQTVRQQLSSDIAENSVNVRALIVRAEDARLLGEWKMVKQLYMDLNNSNRELLHEYQIRSQNYRDMVESLRKMNMIIQKFANLRIGPPKAELIQLCRGLIKQNNLKALSRVLSSSE